MTEEEVRQVATLAAPLQEARIALARSEVSDDDFGMLVWCALGYDRRLPHGQIPAPIWEALSHGWRAKINQWKNADLDHLGAQVRNPGREHIL